MRGCRYTRPAPARRTTSSELLGDARCARAGLLGIRLDLLQQEDVGGRQQRRGRDVGAASPSGCPPECTFRSRLAASSSVRVRGLGNEIRVSSPVISVAANRRTVWFSKALHAPPRSGRSRAPSSLHSDRHAQPRGRRPSPTRTDPEAAHQHVLPVVLPSEGREGHRRTNRSAIPLGDRRRDPRVDEHRRRAR